MVSVEGIRHWCKSIKEVYDPQETIQRGRAPRMVPETFLACAIRYLEACCDDLEKGEDKNP